MITESRYRRTSSTNIEQVMPAKLTQALVNPLFLALDSALCSGRHISLDELDNHVFLMGSQEYLEEFCAYYNVELICAPEGFFYLRPRSATLIPCSVLSELNITVGKILCYLYLSLERLANEGILTQQGLYDEPLTLADEAKLLKLMNSRSTGSDVDCQKLQEEVRSSLNRLHRLGMMWLADHDSGKFRITGSVFRLGADVHAGDDPREAQCRLTRDGEAMPIKNHLQPNDEAEEDQPDNGGEE